MSFILLLLFQARVDVSADTVATAFAVSSRSAISDRVAQATAEVSTTAFAWRPVPPESPHRDPLVAFLTGLKAVESQEDDDDEPGPRALHAAILSNAAGDGSPFAGLPLHAATRPLAAQCPCRLRC